MGRSLVGLLTLVLACGGSTPNYPPPQESPPDAKLGPGDRLDVKVFFSNQELANQYVISGGGTISIWYVGDVDAAGRTQAELKDDIQAKLADGYLVNPVVSVSLVESRSQKISVLGEVQRPSTLTLSDGMTIIDAISQAGGFTPLAKKNSVIVTRVVDGMKKRFTVPVESIAGSTSSEMFILEAGDVVFVPERRW